MNIVKQDKALLKNHKAKAEEQKYHEGVKAGPERSLADKNRAVVLREKDADATSTPRGQGNGPAPLS